MIWLGIGLILLGGLSGYPLFALAGVMLILAGIILYALMRALTL